MTATDKTVSRKHHLGLPLREAPEGIDQCPFCLERVGLLGRFFMLFSGVGFHGCTMRNVLRPGEPGWRFPAVGSDT